MPQKKASQVEITNSLTNNKLLQPSNAIDRELIKKHLSSASWVNKEDDELEARKSNLRYLIKLGKKLRAQTFQTSGIVVDSHETEPKRV